MLWQLPDIVHAAVLQARAADGHLTIAMTKSSDSEAKAISNSKMTGVMMPSTAYT